MAGQQNDRGLLFLFPNQYKTEDKHPYLTGTGDIHVSVLKELMKIEPDEKGIIKVQAAAFSRVSKAGQKYSFVTFGPKYERGNAEVPNPGGESKPPHPDEDIPF